MAPLGHGPEPGKLVGRWEKDCAHCRIYRQMCVHFLGWCAVWLSALLFHTSVSCVTVFSTRFIHSVVITHVLRPPYLLVTVETIV